MKVVISLTHNCNLACTYCYAGQPWRRNIPLDTARKAVDFGFANSSPAERLEFGFFGGRTAALPQADSLPLTLHPLTGAGLGSSRQTERNHERHDPYPFDSEIAA